MAATFTDPPKDFSAADAGASRYIKQLAALEHRAESERNNTNSWRLPSWRSKVWSTPGQCRSFGVRDHRAVRAA